MINIVALPCLCVDVFDGTNEMHAGGEALNFAAHASRFEEINVSLIGAVGQDSYADCIMNAITDKKIDVSHIRVEKGKVTANNRTYLTPDGDRYYKEDSWTGDIVDEMILNQNELEVVKNSDVVFLSDEKIQGNHEEFLISIYKEYKNKIIVLGQGKTGALMLDSSENKIYSIKSVYTRPVVNTVGAGDSLFSAFVHFYLKNLSPVECLKNAVTFASYKIGESGGAKGFLTEPELKKTVKNLDFEIFTVRDKL